VLPTHGSVGITPGMLNGTFASPAALSLRALTVKRVCATVLLVQLLGGCASLPANGPTVREVSKAVEASSTTQMPYTLVNIDADVVRRQIDQPDPRLAEFGALASDGVPERVDLIRRGDTLTVSIFEVGISLFAGNAPAIAADTLRAPTAGVQTLSLQVREDGSVDLPYIGTIQAAGIYPEALAAAIKQRMQGISEHPDAMVTISDSLKNAVYVVGVVGHPGHFRLTAAHERLLDLLAIAGGSPIDFNELQVTLVRGPHTVSAPLNQISPGSPADLRLMPGDRIVLDHVQQSYTVFGATDRVSQVPFAARKVSLAEAVARVSGPADSRADPRGVYLFRLEKADDGTTGAVIYQINMLKPQAYFLAQTFPMRDKDVIVFANSSSNALQKVLSLMSQLFNPAVAVRTATH